MQRPPRTGSVVALGLVFLGIPLLLLSVGVAMVVMFLGSALFALANCTAYRIGDPHWILPPAIASPVFVGSCFLALVALVATLPRLV